MKTIKLPIYVEMSGKSSLSEFQRVQNSVIKIAYNRYREGLSEKDIREYIKTKIDPNIDSWFVQSAIYRAKDMYLKDLESEKKKQIRLTKLDAKVEASMKREEAAWLD